MAIDYTLKQLEALPTLSTSQSCDLKIESSFPKRVWLSRCGVEDGEPYPNKVTVEYWDVEEQRWIEERTYQAK